MITFRIFFTPNKTGIMSSALQVHSIYSFIFFSTFSFREDYVSYLENYIKVDIYGSCGNLECTPDKVSICTFRQNKTDMAVMLHPRL